MLTAIYDSDGTCCVALIVSDASYSDLTSNPWTAQTLLNIYYYLLD
jgi:hypothetical protein